MTWTMFTPFVPYVRLLLLGAALFLACSAAWQIYRETQETDETPLEAVKRVRSKLVVAGLAAVLAVLFTASSAHRPKDRIAADYSDREAYLEQVDQSEDAADPEQLGTSGPQTVDWEAARTKFRSQVEEEEEQFERATSDR